MLTVVGFSLAFFALSKFGNFGQVACSLFVVILGASNFCEESNPPDDISSYFLLIATIFFFVYLIIAKINTILFSDAISDTTEKLEIAKMRQNAMQIQLVIEFEKNPIVNYFLDSFDQDYWRITEDLETEILRTDRFDSEFFKRATKQFEVRTTSILEIQNVNYKFSQPWKQLEREENSAL